MHSTHLADVHYLPQGDPLGLGHAVLKAKQHIAPEPFAVLLGDDIIDAQDSLLAEMIRVHNDLDASVIARM